MPLPTAGFRELDHTADWALRVWAPDLPALFRQAATGMFQLSGVELKPQPRVQREFSLQAQDSEGLLVSFLSELLYYGEREGLGFDDFDIQISDHSLVARVSGASFAERKKEIKAVTYNDLAITPIPEGFEAVIVFDV